jgi:Na+/serine symporter
MAGAAVTITVLTLATVHTLGIHVDLATMVILSGIDTLAVDGLTPKRSAKSKLTGMFAAELRVKNAVCY